MRILPDIILIRISQLANPSITQSIDYLESYWFQIDALVATMIELIVNKEHAPTGSTLSGSLGHDLDPLVYDTVEEFFKSTGEDDSNISEVWDQCMHHALAISNIVFPELDYLLTLSASLINENLEYVIAESITNLDEEPDNHEFKITFIYGRYYSCKSSARWI